MSFWNVPRMQQNNYGWGNAVADIAGAFIQRNQKQEDEQKAQKNMQSMLGLFQPSTVDTQTGTRNTVQFDPAIGKMQPEQPELYQPSLGMPSGLLAQNQPKQPMFQTELNPVPQAQQPQIQTPVIGQKMRTIRDVETDLRRDWATRLQEASRTVDPTMFRQYLPQLQQQMKLEIDQAKNDYSTQQINDMVAKMNGAKSLKEAAGYVTELSRLGVKVPVDLIKEQFATKKNELKFAPDGTMFLNGEMQGEKGQYGKPVIVGGGYGGGGGRVSRGATGGTQADSKQMTNAKYVVDKHTAWVEKNTNKITGDLPDETKSPYYKYLGAAQKTLDGYYGIGGDEVEQSQPQEQGNQYESMWSSITKLLESGDSPAAVQSKIRQVAPKYGLDPEHFIQNVNWSEWEQPQQQDVMNPDTGFREGSILDELKTNGLSGVAGRVFPNLYR